MVDTFGQLTNTFYLGWGSLALINAVLAQGKTVVVLSGLFFL